MWTKCRLSADLQPFKTGEIMALFLYFWRALCGLQHSACSAFCTHKDKGNRKCLRSFAKVCVKNLLQVALEWCLQITHIRSVHHCSISVKQTSLLKLWLLCALVFTWPWTNACSTLICILINSLHFQPPAFVSWSNANGHHRIKP